MPEQYAQPDPLDAGASALADAGHYREIANHLGPYCCKVQTWMSPAMIARYFSTLPSIR